MERAAGNKEWARTTEMVFQMPPFDDLVKWISDSRKKLGLSQQKVARAAGLTSSTISKVEGGLIKNYDTLFKVVSVLREEVIKRKEVRDIFTLFAERIMHGRVETVSADETVYEVWRKMKEKAYSQFPVEDQGKIVGSITEMGINRAIETFGAGEARRIKVREIMEDPFPQIPLNTPLPLIIHLLRVYQAVLVVKGGEVIGIITNTDIGEAFEKIE